ncbi:hypothetical protein [Amaricoccus sp.]|uniref:hypothetical protein n=1 Tax=Amaricoccus sp. TaxID=1872485 RepID=UPI001B425D57|nr:hypothetical protein [Amaricoccus sp.]MBP7000120.1 hypothetical protein [Amaricoccus sp.]
MTEETAREILRLVMACEEDLAVMRDHLDATKAEMAEMRRMMDDWASLRGAMAGGTPA